ncbi:ACT domain-containing protein, partial [Campylobacter jejuni]|nr:ACT domain-containing protein [Campylobacter jejuni]
KAPMLGFVNTLEYELLSKDEIYTKYYLRVKVEDKIGVLSKITQLMSENNISIDSFLQKPKKNDENYSTLFFTTHLTYEKSIQNLLEILRKQDFIKTKPFMMRIE